jgi:bifunctional UDP-N-acetylglucosamine pyrophosphorylase/glucosamine-1-phosphate N-acetyltransferase
VSKPRIGAVILAAGKGTRLKTERPKVLHEICGRPMLHYVLDACRAAGVHQSVVVVGYQKDQVIEACRGQDDLVFVEQKEQLGTGHAILVCRDQLLGKFDHLLVLCGDGPLIRRETIQLVLQRHLDDGAAVTLATAEVDDPDGYGRIHRDAHTGRLLGIVEHKDCTPEQRRIREINPSYYCFNADELLASILQIDNKNAKGEYYITDTLGLLIQDGKQAVAITAVPPEDVFSINSRQDLALVNRIMRDRILNKLMDEGVTIVDPQSTWIDDRAVIGRDTIVHP